MKSLAQVILELQNKIYYIIKDAPDAYDTLKEIADWIKKDETGAAAMATQIANKADKNHTHNYLSSIPIATESTLGGIKITCSTTDLQNGVSPLENGKLYFVIEE